MKTVYVISDIHCDCFLPVYSNFDVEYDEFAKYLDKWFNQNNIPRTNEIVIAGDIANDFLKYTQFIRYISGQYDNVYIVLGNHDLCVNGRTLSKSNDKFETSAEKIASVKEYAKTFNNVYLLDGDVVNDIGGTMGMSDFSFKPIPFKKEQYISEWKYNFFDGKTWNYYNNNPEYIWQLEKEKLEKIVKKQPKIVLTHYLPMEAGCEEMYKNSYHSCFFFFEGKQFLEKMPNNSYWICGHSHSARKLDYKCKNGNIVHILCNPFGYTFNGSIFSSEHPYNGTGLTEADFIIKE